MVTIQMSSPLTGTSLAVVTGQSESGAGSFASGSLDDYISVQVGRLASSPEFELGVSGSGGADYSNDANAGDVTLRHNVQTNRLLFTFGTASSSTVVFSQGGISLNGSTSVLGSFESGSFTASYTGAISGTTVVEYVKVDNRVTLSINEDLRGTASGSYTYIQLYNIPSQLGPTTAYQFFPAFLINNNTQGLGQAVTVVGGIDFQALNTAGGVVEFTGTSAVKATAITYLI